MRELSVFLGLAILAAIGLAPRAQDRVIADKIIWKGERAPTEGSVVSLNFFQIKYRLSTAGGEQEDFAKEVKDIEFDTDNPIVPYEYTHGVNAMNKGNHEEAVKQFEKAISRIKQSNSPNHPLRDFCRKHIVESHMAAGDLAAVETAAKELRKEKPDSFFLRDSFLMQYESAKARRNTPLQEATIKELDEVIKADRRFADQLGRDAELLRADMMETNKNFAGALTVYTKLGGDRELWEGVSLGILRCLGALGKTGELKTKVESLLLELKDRREKSPRVYLGAIIGQGDVYLAEGKIKDALLEYLKGALDPGSAGRTYEHETALAKAAIAAAKYGKQFGEKDKPNKILYIDRAKDLREELNRTFRASVLLTDVDAAIKDAMQGQ